MIKVFIAAVLAFAALTGCGGTVADQVSGAETERGYNTPTATSTTTRPNPTTSRAPTTTPPRDDIAGFGETFTYTDGISVMVQVPAPYTPSENPFIDWPAQPHYLSFVVLIVNGSSEPFDASMVTMSLQSLNTEMERLFDTAQGVEGAPRTTLLPGREVSFIAAFGVADPNDLVMEISVSFVHEDVIYTNGPTP